MTADELIHAIRWRLGVLDGTDFRHHEKVWAEFQHLLTQERRNQITRFLSTQMEQAVKIQLGSPRPVGTTPDQQELYDSLWGAFRNWLDQDRAARSPLVTDWFRQIVQSWYPTASAAAGRSAAKGPGGPRPAGTTVPGQADPGRKTPLVLQPVPRVIAPPQPPSPPARPATAGTDAPSLSPGSALTLSVDEVLRDSAPPTNLAAAGSAEGVASPVSSPVSPAGDPVNPTGDAVSGMGPPNKPVRPAGSPWQYKEVPTSEPDRHEECYSLGAWSPEGWPYLGARVRGKKHKHEGTNCDDWFTVQTSGCWTVIAVSDGAGSRKFSRVGAQASCEGAVQFLASYLARARIEERAELPASFFQRRDDGHFVEPEVDHVQRGLHEAVQAAFEAVTRAYQARVGNSEYDRALGRKLDLNDLSATLLLAVHTTVTIAGRRCSFVLACQLGDGMIAGVLPDGQVTLLAEAESGDFSGETDFLTSERMRKPETLYRKTFVLLQPIRALLAMTDGVADDYFPQQAGMARLYADLVLNDILAPCTPGGDPQRDPAGPAFDPADGQLDSTAEAIRREGARPVRLRSAEKYAAALALPDCAGLVSRPDLLRAGARGAALGELSSAKERLELWLDAYQVRGSFDDRTLVVLHREEAP